SWSRERRVIGKAEALPPTAAGGHPKENHRFIVTSLPARTHPPQQLYEQLYCARGDAENRVKEHKLHLFSARCSSNLFGANTLRFYLSTFAMILFRGLRDALRGTRLAVASAGRIRLRLLKIGALVRIAVRRVYLAMSSACPDQDLFRLAWDRLNPT
ncbi:MAG: transposase, partial [Acidobacteriota bacterium]|nr:transposase [Acidobacteriota bacterium]